MSRSNLKLKNFIESLGLVIFLCSRSNLKFKTFSEGWGRASYHVQTKSEISVQRLYGGIFTQANLKFKIFGDGWGVSHLSMSRPNLKFKIFMWGLGVSHLSMSRPNLKFKISVRGCKVHGGLVIFPCPGQIWNLNLWRVGHLPCPDQIWNWKFHWGWGVSHLSLSRPNLKFKIYGGRVGHLSMSRLNLKFKIFSEGGGSVIFPYLGKIWN